MKLHLEEQALLFTKKRCQNIINNVCNQSTQTIDDYKISLDEIVYKVKPQEEYSKACKELQKIVDDKDYLAALRVINNKGLLPFTNVSQFCSKLPQSVISEQTTRIPENLAK